MSVSARTYQVLDVMRQLLTTRDVVVVPDISSHIVDLRKGPDAAKYSKAYISPQALDSLVARMCHVDRLITQVPGGYQLSAMGSQIADLMKNLDGCSQLFQDGYKEMLVGAALMRREAVGQGPADARQIAAITYLSLDSVRRGLSSLLEANTDVREIPQGRSSAYQYVCPNSEIPEETESDEQGALKELGELLSTLDPGEATSTNALRGQELEEFEELIRGIDQVVAAGPVATSQEKDSVVLLEDEGDSFKDEEDMYKPVANFSQEVMDEWEGVPLSTQKGFLHLARACGFNLKDYMEAVLQNSQNRVRESLLD